MMYEDFVPERLAKLRALKGVSARDMSLSLGQANNYINNIENKKSLPAMQSFFYICEYLGVTPHVGMHPVGAPLAGHAAALVGECRMVVEPVYPLARGIFAQHRIQFGYRLRRSHLPAPAELRGRRYGT